MSASKDGGPVDMACLWCAISKSAAKFSECWPDAEAVGFVLSEHHPKEAKHIWKEVIRVERFYGKSITDLLSERRRRQREGE